MCIIENLIVSNHKLSQVTGNQWVSGMTVKGKLDSKSDCT